MKKIYNTITIGMIIVSIIITFPLIALASEYVVYVSRLDNNLYQDRSSGVIIKTSLCLELALGDKAILVWDEVNYFDCGKLIFLSSGESCQVDGVFK